MTKPQTPTPAELQPDPEAPPVQTGDEEAPVTRPGGHQEDMKQLYDKQRRDRAVVQASDAENHPDVDATQRLVAQALETGELEHDQVPDEFDLENRPDRFASEDPETPLAEVETPPETPPETPAPAAETPPETPPAMSPPEVQHLDYEVVDGRVLAKVDGNEYWVPEADVIDAGGLAQYQIQRASNLRLKRLATDAAALNEERAELEQLRRVDPASRELPESDALDEAAELEGLTNQVLDAALGGSRQDVEAVVAKIRSASAAQSPTPAETSGSTQAGQPRQGRSAEIVEDFEQTYELQRAEANAFMQSHYSDIMGDPELREIAHRKFQGLEADPINAGRTPLQMAREAAEFARRIAHKGGQPAPTPETPQQRELRVRREKKRVLPQPSSAAGRSPAPEEPKPASARDHIRRLRRAAGDHTAS